MTKLFKKFLLICLFNFFISKCELITVFSISRHGYRYPCHKILLSKSEYSNGLLKPEGEKQIYELGLHFRKEYSKHIDDKNKNFYFRSTRMKRTIYSAMQFSKALTGQNNCTIFSVPLAQDSLLKSSSDCPRYSSIYERHLIETEVNFFKKFDKFLNYEKIVTIKDYFRACDQILNDRSNFDETLFRKCKNVLDYRHKEIFGNRQLSMLKGFPLFVHIIDIFNEIAKFIDDDEASSFKSKVFIDDNELRRMPPRFISYFSHDSTISLLLHYLNIHSGHVPGEGYTFIAELHKNGSRDYFARFRYIDGVDLNSGIFKIDSSHQEEYSLISLNEKIQKDLINSSFCYNFEYLILENLIKTMFFILAPFLLLFRIIFI